MVLRILPWSDYRRSCSANAEREKKYTGRSYLPYSVPVPRNFAITSPGGRVVSFFTMPFLILAFICCDLGASASVDAAPTSPFALQVFLCCGDCLLPDIVLPCPFCSANRTCVRLLYSEKVLCTDVMQSTQTILLRTALPLRSISLDEWHTLVRKRHNKPQ